MIKLSQWWACLGIVAASFLLVTLPAQGQVKGFHISGSGVGPLGLPLMPGGQAPNFIDKGNASHLGTHTGSGSVRTDTLDVDLETGTITGEFGSGDIPFTFKGKKGDRLVCYYGREDKGATDPGTYVLTILDMLPSGLLVVEAHFLAEFVVQPELCTGTFAGVTGSWSMDAWSEPFILGDPVYYSWEGKGRLNFPRKK